MRKFKRKDKYYVYIIQCKNGTYYTGYTKDLEHRIKLHDKGDGAKYLRGKGPIELVYVKEYLYYKYAVKKESAIKKLTHKEKEKLVDNHERSKETE